MVANSTSSNSERGKDSGRPVENGKADQPESALRKQPLPTVELPEVKKTEQRGKTRTSRLIDVAIIHKHLGIQVDCKKKNDQRVDATGNTRMAEKRLPLPSKKNPIEAPNGTSEMVSNETNNSDHDKRVPNGEGELQRKSGNSKKSLEHESGQKIRDEKHSGHKPEAQPSPDSNIVIMSSGRFIVISSEPKVAVFPPGSQIHLGDLRHHSFHTSGYNMSNDPMVIPLHYSAFVSNQTTAENKLAPENTGLEVIIS
ncbi:unnamed protein product [Rodentolepis nana]|uniref:Ovule protein n=1 Tax=Rodentolepis nana TaxID=102285 RepID=A0A0R3TES7_RODNA|nr:unnamed protein product [Rodentolepis nana]